ncbi:hypothetical protein ILUMI_23446 [Ignelater luminosus]|uniref:Peptidase S1 domain-containing protein n=1 Tax=Ignelater luminosus TaxID=2038154 RepID=A0A8K0C8S2_IGNLU|nr:hypothetical protein ILUMI_23446 [Ignelater luminosus]
MYRLILLSVIATACFASPLPDSGRVVNGTDAKEGEIPWIVSLRKYGSHSCGGSILDETHILTAAHCVVSASARNLQIQYGVLKISSRDNIVQVKSIKVHEKFSPGQNNANDVAILTLESPIIFGDNVHPVTLPQQGATPPGGETGVLAGWGLPYSGGGVMEHLQRVDLIIYTDEECSKAHGSRVDSRYHLCGGVPEGGKGQCNGDSGGSLTHNGVQHGVVSWSVKPCTIKGYPGVYARVVSYVDWIYQQVRN